jgi:primosomal protein N' (replication factor Y)
MPAPNAASKPSGRGASVRNTWNGGWRSATLARVSRAWMRIQHLGGGHTGGLDFPGVTVVGVVDADIGLHLPDFRAAERTFQLIAQVAGRAGRGEAGGRVLVQTRAPDHYALTAAAVHDFERFAARELDVRRSPPYPPHVGLVNVLMTGSDEPAVANAAIDIADWLRELVSARAQGVVQIVGPAPAPLVRIKGRWRWHLLLRASERKVLSRIVQYAVRRAPHAARGAIRAVFDRDPVSLL